MTLKSLETGASVRKCIGYTPTKRFKTTSGRIAAMDVARSHHVKAISAAKWSNEAFFIFYSVALLIKE